MLRRLAPRRPMQAWAAPVTVLVATALTLTTTLPAAMAASVPTTATVTTEDPLDVAVRAAQAHALTRVAATTARVPTTAWPLQTTAGDPLWRTVGARNWASGFFPGQLWNTYQATGNKTWATNATRWTTGLAGQALNTTNHDVGFQINNSFGNGYRLTGNDTYRATVLRAAASLSTRYSAKVGAIRSWNSGPTEFKVIIDTMMNLELMFWASKHGGQRAWYDQAYSHALKTARNHVRPDGSTYHLLTYDPATGKVLSRTTVQGAADHSTWARGQAWAIYGFTVAYRETKDTRFLDVARRASDWYLAHIPADRIPYWDFDAPGIPDAARDTSAAAVAASGLLELARRDPDPARRARYTQAGRDTVAALSSSPWLTTATSSEAVLAHGTYSAPAGNSDTGLIWGDYYLQEAMLRLRLLPPTGPVLPVAAVTASSSDSNTPAGAVDNDPATRWSAYGDGQWLRVDLGQPRTVTKVSVSWFKGNVRAAHVDLQTSTDGTTWRTAVRAISSGTTTGAETYDIRDTTARYVRLVGHGATGTRWTSITRLAAIG